MLNSTANPAHFHPSLAGLAVLFSRQLPNGSHDFFQTFSICFFFYHFIKNPQTTIALPFLTHNNSAIGSVLGVTGGRFREIPLRVHSLQRGVICKFLSGEFALSKQITVHYSCSLYWDDFTLCL